MTVTTLIENSPGAHRTLEAEHGISFLIRTGEKTILFDTGQTGKIISNAHRLGIALEEQVDQVVLSHGHYDHTGGLISLLGLVPTPPPIHVGAGFFRPKYSRSGPTCTYIGPDFTRADLESRGSRVQEQSSDTLEIVPGVYGVTNFDRTLDPDWPNPRFVLPEFSSTGEISSWVVDSFDDEVALVLDSPQGLVLLVGCSHPGILNMIYTVETRFGKPLAAVLGGTHLVEAHGPRLEKVLQALEARPSILLGMSHCTGKEAMAEIEKRCSGYYHNCTGTSLFLNSPNLGG
ncbi:MAG: MBL fold metallo-hydrolase [Spirochaetales bacterium]|nr:MBL fold metallo-hydrolase [Spirochaetales bacterium]